jgi:hypothetical protein
MNGLGGPRSLVPGSRVSGSLLGFRVGKLEN